MQCTQLTCPHCGSTLNFNGAISAGATVECLICMRAFAAENPVSAAVDPPPKSNQAVALALQPAPAAAATGEEHAEIATLTDGCAQATVSDTCVQAVASAAATKAKSTRAGKSEVLTSKPYAAPPASAVKEKSVPATPPPLTTAAESPKRKAAASPLRTHAPLIAGSLGLLLLLTCTISIGIWKVATTAGGGSSPSDDPKIASDGLPKDSPAKPANAGQSVEDDGLVTLSEGEEADIRTKVQNEVKQLLARKPSEKPGAPDVPWEPIASVPVVHLNGAQLDQKRINGAIDKGVAFLKRTQKPDGTWHNGHPVGHASIGGLTLLECGAPGNDVHVQRSAQYIRSHSGNLGGTYELSLAILFLDRLGETRDRPIIQVLALRLMAGQNDAGGWTYNCPVMTPQDNYQLLHFLRSNKRPELLNPLGGTKTQSGIVLNPVRDPSKLNDPFQQFNDLVLEKGIASPKANPPAKPPKEGLIAPIGGDAKKPPSTKPPTPPGPAIRPEALKPNLQKLPVVQNQGKKKNQVARPGGKGAGDNSNTQFAMLALWAARRHDVPTDYALLASYQRFMGSQNADGGWSYHSGGRNSTASMTCVGLLGLALGHGAAPDVVNANAKNLKDIVIKPALEDRDIQRGLQALARNIGEPALDPKPGNLPMQNLYFLWSVERVAMLYDLKTIGGKDWYGWGAQILVHNQRAEGDWINSQYHGAAPSLNTCFALLFLRRSNLVLDLTDSLRLQSGIRYPN